MKNTRNTVVTGILVLGLSVAAPTLRPAELTEAQRPNAEAFQAMHYGIFIDNVYKLTPAPESFPTKLRTSLPTSST